MAFKVKSYIWSKVATNKSIDNTPGVDKDSDSKLTSEYVLRNLENLHNKCVDPIMRHFNNLPGSSGNSIGITSAYRCKTLNSEIGGVENSQHIQGMAVDIVYTEGESSQVYNWAITNLPTWSQIIWEFPEKKGMRSWVHISYNEEDNKKTKSLASNRDDLHEHYKTQDTERRGIYTHGLTMEADQTLI